MTDSLEGDLRLLGWQGSIAESACEAAEAAEGRAGLPQPEQLTLEAPHG